MHDELFEQPAVVARYRAGPYTESRERFLWQARADGYSPATLARMAWALLVVAEAVHREGGRITSKQLRSVLRKTRFKTTARPPSANTIKLLLQPGERWLRSLGALIPEAEAEVRDRTARLHRAYACRAGPFSNDDCRSRRTAALVLCFIAVSGALAPYGDYCPRRCIPGGLRSPWMEPQVFVQARQ